MSEQKSSSNASPSEVSPVRLARLYRQSSTSLSAASRQAVQECLLDRLGFLLAEVPAVPQSDPAESFVEDDAAPGDATFAKYETALRRLVEVGANWTRMQPTAWQLFRKAPTAELGASLVELAFLHGNAVDVAEVLTRLKVYGTAFYSLIHPSVRAHACADLWACGRKESIAEILVKDKGKTYLHPVERLVVFLALLPATDPTNAYIYFRTYTHEIFAAVEEAGATMEITRDYVLLAAGRCAIDVGYDEEALAILGQISPQSPQYDLALKHMHSVSEDVQDTHPNQYLDLLMALSDWRERLRKLREFFATTRELGGFRDSNRPGFNQLLKDPLKWMPKSAEAWADLSRTLVQSRDLEPLLPNIYEVFRANALVFHGPSLDAALWQGPLSVDGDARDARDVYWQGVAQLHQYTSFGSASESTLWTARKNIEAAKTQGPILHDWRILQKGAVQYLTRSNYIFERERLAMMRQLKIAGDAEMVAISDVEDYLKATQNPPLAVMEDLREIARLKNAKDLEIRIVLKRAEITHLRNQDLNTLWSLALERRDHDLAWRVASILHARGALNPQVRHAWEISGEKRSHYPIMAPTLDQVKLCFAGAPDTHERLGMACVQIGSTLPELLAMLDAGSKAIKLAAPGAGSVEAEIDLGLRALPWLKPATKRYQFSYDTHALGGAILPAFVHVLPSNVWSLLAIKVSEHLGIHSWGWKVSRLHEQIADLIPRLASRQDLKKYSGKVARWLRQLAPEERGAWQDLAVLSRALTDEQAHEALAGFIVRLSTTLMQNHYMALTSLQTMRAPIAVIWNLENWIVSPEYSAIREKLGTKSKAPVPNALQRLATIVVGGPNSRTP